MSPKPLLWVLLVGWLAGVPGNIGARQDRPTATEAPLGTLFLQGTIADRGGAPVVGARVDIRLPYSQQVIADTPSDVDGRFAFLGLPLQPRKYVVHASGPGYAVAEQEIDVVQPVTQLRIALTLGAAERPRGAPQRFVTVRVLYATDRQARFDQQHVTYLSSKGALAFGSCDVSIPETHELAAIERPSIWKFEFHLDPEKHIVLQKVLPEAETAFFQDVSRMAAASPKREAFVFVHGYNVTFEAAALRTAQLAYDLRFQGAPIFYSWPSKGSLFGYPEDERSVQQTAADLRRFLEKIASASGVATVHLIAHSMGNRALLPALAELDREPAFGNSTAVHEIVLAAPDMDRDTFVSLAAEIRRPTQHVTLYVSSRDQALQAAVFFFRSPPRAGQGGNDVIVLPGIDTVDVSPVTIDALGHTYYGDNPNVVADLLKIFRSQHPPRPGLVKALAGRLTYWLMQPALPADSRTPRGHRASVRHDNE